MRTLLRLLALVASAALAACGGGTLSTDEGQIRLVNATSGFAGLDLFANNVAVATGVAPYTASGYDGLKAGSYPLTIQQTGNAATLVTTSTTISKKNHQTVVAYTSGGTMMATVLSDEEGAPGSGTAKFLVFNTASADAGNVDVYLITDACATLSSSAAAPIATNVAGLQTAFSVLTSSATAYHVCITGVGDKTDLRLDIPSFVLSEKRIVTVILAVGPGGYLMNAIVLDQQAAAAQALNASARVRVAASISPSVPASVEVNGTAISAGLDSPNVGPYTLVPAGDLAVKVNGNDIAPVTPLTAAPASDVTVLLTGSTPTVTLLADDNTASPSTARPVKLRLVNGLNGITGTATLTLNNVLVGTGAASGTASGYTQAASSAGLARLEARIGTVQVYFAPTATLESGRVYTLFLLGDAAQAPNTGILIPDR
ncbi:MAG TPA: DUF4397 domain-containing protein [Caldimonas sp.]|jgi:hypothetical protein|nr:DUF4397 domain-containing protein [Caldimonas sp.]HEX4234330.1 DUF4397 domain-containing protein [Caldimonas sp.]